MAKVSSDTADKVEDFGVATGPVQHRRWLHRQLRLDQEAMDLAPMLASLPGGHCSCPHWGYMLAGRMVVSYGDRDEVTRGG